MKLKRIIAGITACTIVGSTMLTMPISARTTTKAEKVTLSDLLNTAKMAVDLKDDLTAEKQAEILDKFDTNGNGQISIGELLAVAQRVARTDESDIVNEYGTADSEETTTETTIETSETTETTEVTTTEETSETTVETTETTEETTTTTEAVAFNPVISIDGTEYKDGDNFVAEANGIYEVNATDAENEVTVSLTGSKDDNNNNLVRVSENRFEVLANGTLTITVKSADGQQKTITLNIKVGKSLEDADKTKLCISYQYEGINYSDNYKNFSNEIGRDVFNNKKVEDPEEYWSEIENRKHYSKLTNTIYIDIGTEIKISGFAIVNTIEYPTGDEEHYEDYDTTDKITYISTDTNKVTIDEDGVITGIASGDAEIIVMVNGKEFSRFTVNVDEEKSFEVEASGEEYVIDNFGLLTEGKYVENASQGKALSLKDLQNQVGAENVRSVSFKNFDGTQLEINGVAKADGIMYYLDTATSTFYYAITSETGKGSFEISIGNDGTGTIAVEVLDMEQYKKYQAEQVKAEEFTVEFYGNKVATATADGTQYYYGDSSELPYVYIAEGETFSLSDIVKVSGVDDPKITVTNSDNGTSAQNLEYDPLTKTFTALELTEENSDINNIEQITLTYTASDGTTRTIKFYVAVAEPVFKLSYTFSLQRNDSGKYYCTAEQLEDYLDIFNRSLYLVDASKYSTIRMPYCKLTVDNKKMFSVTEAKNEYGSYDKLSLADGYEPKAGDTATITATASYWGDTIIFSPNFKAITYTIEVVDTLPEISRTLASDTFDYPEDNKSNQDITFENIIEIKNLKDGYKVVPVVSYANNNVGYINQFGEKCNLSNMTVDATGLELVEETNGRYSISGIKVASASKVDSYTYIGTYIVVLDADGNIVSNELIYIYVNGEKPVEITFENTMSVVETTDSKTATYTIKDMDNYRVNSTGNLKVTDENGATIGTAKIGFRKLEVTFDKALEQNEVRNFKVDIELIKTYGGKALEKTVTVSLTAENPSLTFEETTVFEDNGLVTYTLKDSNGWKIKGDEFMFDYYKDGSTSITYIVKIKDGTSLVFMPAFKTSDKEDYVVPVTFEKNGVTVSREYNLTALKSPKIKLENSVVEVGEDGRATFNVNSDDDWTMNIINPEGAEQLKDLATDSSKFEFSFNPELSAGEAKTYQITVKMMKDGIGKAKTFTITAFKAPEITLAKNPITVTDISQPISIPCTIIGGDGWEITPSIDSSMISIESFENGNLTLTTVESAEIDFLTTFNCSKQLDENTKLSATKKVMVTLTKTQTGEDSGDGGDISLP